MTYFGAIIAFTLLMGAGFGIVRLLARAQARPWYELAALSWLFGAGYVSLGLWVFSWITSGRILVGLVSAGAILLWVLGLRLAHNIPKHPSAPLGWAERLLIIGLILQATFVLMLNFRVVFNWDAFMIWEAKARWAFLNGGALPASYFSDSTLINSQPYYPLFFPYLQSWLYVGMGEANQSFIRILGPLFYFAAQAMLVSGVQRLGGSRLMGLLVGMLYITVPYIFTSGWVVGNADLPLGALYLAAVICSLSWLDSRSTGDLRMLGIIAALLPWVKREGKFLWLAVILVPLILLLRGKKWRGSVQLVAPGILLLLVWTVFLAKVHTISDWVYLPVTPKNLLENSDRISPILAYMGSEFCDLTHWGVWWPITGICLIALGIQGSRNRVLALACSLGLPILAYSGVYILSKWPGYLLHMELSTPRLLLHLLPTLPLILGITFPVKPK